MLLGRMVVAITMELKLRSILRRESEANTRPGILHTNNDLSHISELVRRRFSDILDYDALTLCCLFRNGDWPNSRHSIIPQMAINLCPIRRSCLSNGTITIIFRGKLHFNEREFAHRRPMDLSELQPGRDRGEKLAERIFAALTPVEVHLCGAN